jgi:hypothetical protein
LWVPAIVAFSTFVPATVLAIRLLATGFPFPEKIILVPSVSRTERTGQLGPDSRDRKAGTGEWDRTAREDCRDNKLGQERKDITVT